MINGYVTLKECEGDIFNVQGNLLHEIPVSDILKNENYSFNGKDYNKKKIICGEGYELKTIGELCEFLPKGQRLATFGKPEGKYNFYTSSDKIKKCDIADYD